MIHGTAYRNTCDLELYHQALRAKKFPIGGARRLDGRTARLRAQILGVALLGVPTELVDGGSAEARFRRWRGQGLVEVRGNHWCLTEEGRLWSNQMQLELLPVRDLLSLVRMLGSPRDQEALLDSPDGRLSGVSREMLRFVKGSGGIAAEARWLAYRGYLKLLKSPLFDSRAVGWNGAAD